MLENQPYKTLHPKDSVPITEFYTTAEIKEKYSVKESWLYKIAKEHNIPRTFNRGKTYWSKRHIDSYFAKKTPDASITEWYSVHEIQEKFGMTLSAIYSFVSKNVIPKKKWALLYAIQRNILILPKELPSLRNLNTTLYPKRWRNSTSRATSYITMLSITTSLASRLENTPK